MIPVVNNVPVSSGIVIVLSAVGLVTVKVVSFASADEPSNTIEELNVGTASNVNALPVADDVSLGILESSSIVNSPFCVSNAFALNVSLTFNLVESVDLKVLPEISTVPKVCVPPEPVILVPVIAPAFNVPVVVKFSEPK